MADELIIKDVNKLSPDFNRGMIALKGKDNLPDDPKPTDAILSSIGLSLPINTKRTEDVVSAVWALMRSGVYGYRQIALELQINPMRVKQTLTLIDNEMLEMHEHIKANPGARRIALAQQASEVFKQAMQEVHKTDGANKARFLGTALRAVVEQYKMEGLAAPIEHKIETVQEEKKTMRIELSLDNVADELGLDSATIRTIARKASDAVSATTERQILDGD